MKARTKNEDGTYAEGWCSQFNTHSTCEAIMGWADGDQDSMYMKDIEIQLTDGTWINLREALQTNKVIPDNYNTYFREPRDDGERQRGYAL